MVKSDYHDQLFGSFFYRTMNQKRKNVNNEATLKKRKVLTFGEKKELCLLHQENPSLSQEEIGKKFDVKKILFVIF